MRLKNEPALIRIIDLKPGDLFVHHFLFPGLSMCLWLRKTDIRLERVITVIDFGVWTNSGFKTLVLGIDSYLAMSGEVELLNDLTQTV